MLDAPYTLIKSKVEVEAPASIANLGPGFDLLAVAIDAYRDRVVVKAEQGNGNIYLVVNGYGVPSDGNNVAYVVTREFIKKEGIKDIDVRIELVKGIPVGAGLGSSAATSVAISYALHVLFKPVVDMSSILYYSAIGEAFVAGVPHYDNISASLYGGFVFIDHSNMRVYAFKPCMDIYIGVVTPLSSVIRERKTQISRSLLPPAISLEDHVRQSSSLVKLVYSIMKCDPRLFGEAITQDYLIEPARSKLIPYYNELKKIALDNGAYGFNIAGAGPSVFFIHEDRDVVTNIAKTLVEFYLKHGIESVYVITKPRDKGSEIIRADD
ncbi:MAG: homoserine kinase [Desulfurococcaceae archaeon]